VRGQFIYDSIIVESADTPDSTPSAEEGDNANSSSSDATDEDNLVVGGLYDGLNEEKDNDDEEMIED
jgi:hypothetical protein